MCGQLVFVEAPEDVDDQELMELAKDNCTCSGAIYERQKAKKMNKISTWVEKEFAEDDDAKAFIMASIRCVNAGIFEKITVKEGKHTYTIDLNKDSLIRIKSKFSESKEENF